jgi:NitT/TauT family transport system ATP-binding protein
MIIPRVHYGVIEGFIEVLDDLGGKSDLASIALKQGLEIDDLLPIIDAGEMLGLINVLSGDVYLTERGHLFIAASPKVRKRMLREIIVDLDPFKKFVNYLKKNGQQSTSKEEVLEFLSKENPSSEVVSDFNWFIEWGRQGLLLKYDADSEIIRLRGKN